MKPKEYESRVQHLLNGRFDQAHEDLDRSEMHFLERQLLLARSAVLKEEVKEAEQRLEAFDKLIDPIVLQGNPKLLGDSLFLQAQVAQLSHQSSRNLFIEAQAEYFDKGYFVEGARAFLNSLCDIHYCFPTDLLIKKIEKFESETNSLLTGTAAADITLVSNLVFKQKIKFLFQNADYSALVNLFEKELRRLKNFGRRERLILKLMHIEAQIFIQRNSKNIDLDQLELNLMQLLPDIKGHFFDLEKTVHYLVWRIGNLKEKSLRAPFLWSPQELAIPFRARAQFLSELSKTRFTNESEDVEIKKWIEEPSLVPEYPLYLRKYTVGVPPEVSLSFSYNSIMKPAKEMDQGKENSINEAESEPLHLQWNPKMGELSLSATKKVLFRCRVGTKKYQIVDKLLKAHKISRSQLMDNPDAMSEARVILEVLLNVNKSVPGLVYANGSEYSVTQKVNIC